jgi:hypothetical protein
MEQFRLDNNDINRAIKNSALTMTPVMFFAMLLGIYIPSIRSGKVIEAFPTSIIIGGIFILMIFIVYFGSRQFRRTLESSTLTFEGNIITREQYNIPTLTFPKADIIEVSRDKNGSYRIKAEAWSSALIIPAKVEQPDRLYKLLSNIVLVVEKTSHDPVIKQIGSALAILLTFVLFELSKDKVVVTISGIILLGIMIYIIIKNQRNKYIDYSTKGSLWSQAFTLIYFAVSIYRKLMM